MSFHTLELGVTMAQLGRLCREEISLSPLASVNEHLVYSHMSLKHITHARGFADITCFSRYFRKRTRITPMQSQAAATKARSIDRRPLN